MSNNQKTETFIISGSLPVALNALTKRIAVYSPGSCLTQKRNAIHLFNLDNPKKIVRYACGINSMDRITISSSGQWMAAGRFSTEHWMNGLLLSLQSGQEQRFYEGNVNVLSSIKPSGSRCVAFDPFDRFLAIAGVFGTSIKLLDVQSIINRKPKILLTLSAELNLFTCEALAWSPDGHLLAQQGTYTNPGFIQKWLKRGILIWQISNNGEVVTAKHLATLEYSGTGLTSDRHQVGLAFDSKGTLLAVGGDHKDADSIKLFSLSDYRLLHTSFHLGSGVCWLDFIPDTEFLASGSMDGVFRLWRIVNKDGNTSLTICNEIPCQGQIAGSIVGNSGKTIFVAHVADSRQIGFTSVMLP